MHVREARSSARESMGVSATRRTTLGTAAVGGFPSSHPSKQVAIMRPKIEPSLRIVNLPQSDASKQCHFQASTAALRLRRSGGQRAARLRVEEQSDRLVWP